MKLPSLINELAITLYSQARKLRGVESLKLTVSRVADSDSRYLQINRGCGNRAVIRMSSHPAPNDNYALNLVVRNETAMRAACEYAASWLKDNYGPEIQTT